MSDLVDTTEMYLRTILDLEEENIVPLRARISERLGHSGPTVSQTIARMERDGLVVVSGDRHLELTVTGRDKAVKVQRKHRLAERLLSDIIGLDWELVHDEACRWEHVISDEVELKLVNLLGRPTESPYGNPIPGLEDLGLEPAESFTSGVTNLVDLTRGRPQAVSSVLRRLGEPVQFEVELLSQLKEAGIVPGNTVTVSQAGPSYILIKAEGFTEGLELPLEIATHVFVAEL